MKESGKDEMSWPGGKARTLELVLRARKCSGLYSRVGRDKTKLLDSR